MGALHAIATEDTAGLTRQLATDGAVIALNWLSSQTTTQVQHAFAQAIAPLPWCNTTEADKAYPDEFFGTNTKRLHGVLQYSPLVEDLLLHPVALSLAQQLVADDNLCLSTGELMAIGPGQSRQRLHRDGVSWQKSGLEREFLFSVNIALTDFTPDNGATVVVPGSHLWAADRQPLESELAFASMPAGSALLYQGRVIHGGGANTTTDTRMGLYFGYLPEWMRPLENCAQTLPASTWEDLRPTTQRLLGRFPDGFVAHF